MERSKVIGPDTRSNKDAWIRVGDLGLAKLVAKSDPAFLSFGELAEKYLANYPFNKQSTKELHEQITRKILLPRWSDDAAIKIDPRKLKSWMLELDVEPPTRGKYKSIMSGMYTWGQCEGLLARGEEYNPMQLRQGSPVLAGLQLRGNGA